MQTCTTNENWYRNCWVDIHLHDESWPGTLMLETLWQSLQLFHSPVSGCCDVCSNRYCNRVLVSRSRTSVMVFDGCVLLWVLRRAGWSLTFLDTSLCVAQGRGSGKALQTRVLTSLMELNHAKPHQRRPKRSARLSHDRRTLGCPTPNSPACSPRRQLRQVFRALFPACDVSSRIVHPSYAGLRPRNNGDS